LSQYGIPKCFGGDACSVRNKKNRSVGHGQEKFIKSKKSGLKSNPLQIFWTDSHSFKAQQHKRF